MVPGLRKIFFVGLGGVDADLSGKGAEPLEVSLTEGIERVLLLLGMSFGFNTLEVIFEELLFYILEVTKAFFDVGFSKS